MPSAIAIFGRDLTMREFDTIKGDFRLPRPRFSIDGPVESAYPKSLNLPGRSYLEGILAYLSHSVGPFDIRSYMNEWLTETALALEEIQSTGEQAGRNFSLNPEKLCYPRPQEGKYTPFPYFDLIEEFPDDNHFDNFGRYLEVASDLVARTKKARISHFSFAEESRAAISTKALETARRRIKGGRV